MPKMVPGGRFLVPEPTPSRKTPPGRMQTCNFAYDLCKATQKWFHVKEDFLKIRTNHVFCEAGNICVSLRTCATWFRLNVLFAGPLIF